MSDFNHRDADRIGKIAAYPELATPDEIRQLAREALERLRQPTPQPRCDECGDLAQTADAIGTPLCRRCRLEYELEDVA